jgi:spore coat polysaccharide biosynthesis protein SpsF (cytidylyltransferase family)
VRTVAIIQARIGSSRLPGKVLYELAGLPMIGFMAKRVQRIPGLDELVLATGEGERNDPLADIAQGLGIAVFRAPRTTCCPGSMTQRKRTPPISWYA